MSFFNCKFALFFINLIIHENTKVLETIFNDYKDSCITEKVDGKLIRSLHEISRTSCEKENKELRIKVRNMMKVRYYSFYLKLCLSDLTHIILILFSFVGYS